MNKQICYVDLDGVTADFDKAMKLLDPYLDISCGENYEERSRKVDQLCQSKPDIFRHLEPIQGALDAIPKLAEVYDVYFLSTPMWALPSSYSDKRIWIENHFGELMEKRLILSHRKDLLMGDFLIDDRIKHGVHNFKGEHIHFGTDKFPNWEEVLTYLLITKTW